MTQFPDAERGIWYSANRTALVDGWVSETMDGPQVVAADGRLPRRRRRHAAHSHAAQFLEPLELRPRRDHAAAARRAAQDAVRVTWLVHEDAVEGRDYQLEKLMPFWQLTSEQDWALCERQQKGVNSSRYQPGAVLDVTRNTTSTRSCGGT